MDALLHIVWGFFGMVFGVFGSGGGVLGAISVAFFVVAGIWELIAEWRLGK
jgi:hypothetical protein